TLCFRLSKLASTNSKRAILVELIRKSSEQILFFTQHLPHLTNTLVDSNFHLILLNILNLQKNATFIPTQILQTINIIVKNSSPSEYIESFPHYWIPKIDTGTFSLFCRLPDLYNVNDSIVQTTLKSIFLNVLNDDRFCIITYIMRQIRNKHDDIILTLHENQSPITNSIHKINSLIQDHIELLSFLNDALYLKNIDINHRILTLFHERLSILCYARFIEIGNRLNSSNSEQTIMLVSTLFLSHSFSILKYKPLLDQLLVLFFYNNPISSFQILLDLGFDENEASAFKSPFVSINTDNPLFYGIFSSLCLMILKTPLFDKRILGLTIFYKSSNQKLLPASQQAPPIDPLFNHLFFDLVFAKNFDPVPLPSIILTSALFEHVATDTNGHFFKSNTLLLQIENCIDTTKSSIKKYIFDTDVLFLSVFECLDHIYEFQDTDNLISKSLFNSPQIFYSDKYYSNQPIISNLPNSPLFSYCSESCLKSLSKTRALVASTIGLDFLLKWKNCLKSGQAITDYSNKKAFLGKRFSFPEFDYPRKHELHQIVNSELIPVYLFNMDHIHPKSLSNENSWMFDMYNNDTPGNNNFQQGFATNYSNSKFTSNIANGSQNHIPHSNPKKCLNFSKNYVYFHKDGFLLILELSSGNLSNQQDGFFLKITHVINLVDNILIPHFLLDPVSFELEQDFSESILEKSKQTDGSNVLSNTGKYQDSDETNSGLPFVFSLISSDLKSDLKSETFQSTNILFDPQSSIFFFTLFLEK
ncbi:hypothetical protein BB560_002664, partial [Smittium megazygosporum]